MTNCPRPVVMVPSSRSSRNTRAIDSRDVDAVSASSCCVNGDAMCTPSTSGLPNRLARSSSSVTTRCMVLPPPYSARCWSVSRNRRAMTSSSDHASRGCPSHSPCNRAAGSSSTSTASMAVIVADRGRPSMADSSPRISPGPHTASITPCPAAAPAMTLMCPASTTYTCLVCSPCPTITSAAANLLRVAAAANAACAAGDSRPQNVPAGPVSAITSPMVLGKSSCWEGTTRMSERQPSVYRAIVVVDVESFSGGHRTEDHRRIVRAGLREMLVATLGALGHDYQAGYHNDTGDGVVVFLTPEIPESQLVRHLPVALEGMLREHNSRFANGAQIRLRVAVHHGQVFFDEAGASASSVIHACRLVDSHPVRDALKRGE